MKVLDELIELLSSEGPSIHDALFKSKVLAHKLGAAELSAWATSELGGYPAGSDLPSYRRLSASVYGTCSNGFYRYNDQPLPVAHLEEKLRNLLKNIELRQSIAVIEKFAEDDSKVAIGVIPEFYPLLSKGIDNEFNVERAWQKPSLGAMKQVVVEVRSRLLDFLLELSHRLPDGEVDPTNIRKVSEEIGVTGLFRNAVFGDNATVVFGGATVGMINNSVSRNDFVSLSAALKQLKVAPDDISSLEAAIAGDSGCVEHSAKSIGPCVRGWMGNMMAKAGTASWQIGLEAAGNLLAAAIITFYGFGGA